MRIIPRFIFIVADDDYDRDSLIEKVKEAVSDESPVVESYYRHESDIYAVLDSALNLPLFAERKIVILKYQDAFLDSDAAVLVEYLAKASKRSTLVVAAHSLRSKKELKGEKQDRAGELREMLEQASAANFMKRESSGVFVEIKSRKKGGEDLIASWARETAQRKDLKMGRDAALFLIEMCGMDRNIIEREIDKLAGFKEKGETATIEDVRTIGAENRVFDIYSLIESICAKDLSRSFMIMQSLMESDVKHSFVLWQLDHFFSKAAIAKHYIKEGIDGEKAARQAGQRYYIGDFLRDIRSLDEERLRKVPAYLLEAERLIRSGLPEKTVLEKLVFDLI